MLIIAGMAAVTLTGCQQQDEVTETPATEPSYVLADLALSLPPSSSGTRLGTDVVQSDGTFRGIQKLSIIPFTKQGKVGASDMPTYYDGFNSYIDRTTPLLKEDFDQRFRYYEKVYLMSGVASFLTYGQATAVTGGKVANGSLIPKVAGKKMDDIPERLSVTAGDLSFELETIYNENLIIPVEAQAIADYLTNIANTPGWKDVDNGKLLNLYKSFINSVGEGKYGVIAGSAANVKAYVNELYQQLNDDGLTSLDIAVQIQDRILGTGLDTDFTSKYEGFSVIFDQNDPDDPDDPGKMEVTSLGSDIYDEYPSNKNLPDGAAVLQWGKKSDNTFGFIPQIQTTNTANVSSMNRYTYPAELYYYGNSLIKTSDDEVPWTKYRDITTWQEVVNLYKSSSVVSSNTKAVAIVDPMQYAVARLQGTVQATSSSLNDADNTSVSLTNSFSQNSFPITGLIVSGQYPVNFDFTPRLDGASEDNEHFVYDSYLSSTPMYLTTLETSPFYTLVMQTHDYEDVTVILELVNNSGTDFKGENGIVYRGTKFYLAGKVELSNGDATAVVESERDDVKSRVFTQDHTTVISMKVSSLAKAYNVMPNIQSGRLEIGVKINLKWAQATPQTIVFEEPEEE